MAIYTVELDGNQFDIEGPDGASEADLLGAARQHQAGGQTTSPAPMAEEAPPSSAPTESKARQFTRKVANALPTVGAIGVPAVGALASGGISLPATAGLAGVGAAGGEAFKQLILRSLGDTEGVPQTAGEAAKEIGWEGGKNAALTYVGGKAFQGVGKGVGLAKDLITKPGAAEVTQLGKETLQEIGERGAEKLVMARGVKETAKKGLIEAEEKAGLHFESTPKFEEYIKNPKKMAEFATKIGQLAKQKPEELARAIDSKTLQLFRKIAQEGEDMVDLSAIAKSQIRNGKDVVTQALGRAEKGIGESLGRFRDASKVVGEIPAEIKQRLIKQKLQNSSDVLSARDLDKKRRVIKNLAYGAAGLFGVKHAVQSALK